MKEAAALCNLGGEKMKGKAEYIPREGQVFSQGSCNNAQVGRSVLYLGRDGWLQRRSKVIGT